jgi:4-hydroxythreonine-4-phosphate dehydrogenase
MKPIIGITMGDPAGIGSEIIVKMFATESLCSMCTPVVIGSKSPLEDIRKILGRSDIKIHEIELISKINAKDGTINLINLDNIQAGDFKYGQINSVAGKASGEYIARSIQMALDKEIDAIVTCPIHKESFYLGGYGDKYAGHTEMLADLTNSEDYTMMLAAGNLRVVHVSTHISLKEAVQSVKKDRIFKVINIAYDACMSLDIPNPKIAVAGLNPHCGEHGLFGEEEIKEIIPAINLAIKNGIDVTGPVPADTIFAKAFGGAFDIVVAMYHDQGHIPVKTVGFEWNKENASWGSMSGVNITLGLPIIRTSVDHGTAFGKAGKGLADYTSLLEALKYAALMAKSKNMSQKESHTTPFAVQDLITSGANTNEVVRSSLYKLSQ